MKVTYLRISNTSMSIIALANACLQTFTSQLYYYKCDENVNKGYSHSLNLWNVYCYVKANKLKFKIFALRNYLIDIFFFEKAFLTFFLIEYILCAKKHFPDKFLAK